MVKCKLCNEDNKVLTKIDFSNVIWRQGKSYEEIASNENIKVCKLCVCLSCRDWIFGHSKVTIEYSDILFNVLSKEKTKITTKNTSQTKLGGISK